MSKKKRKIRINTLIETHTHTHIYIVSILLFCSETSDPGRRSFAPTPAEDETNATHSGVTTPSVSTHVPQHVRIRLPSCCTWQSSGNISHRLSQFAWWHSAVWIGVLAFNRENTDWPNGNTVIKRSTFQIVNSPNCCTTGSVLMKIGEMMHLGTNWPDGWLLCFFFFFKWHSECKPDHCVHMHRMHMAAFSQGTHGV